MRRMTGVLLTICFTLFASMLQFGAVPEAPDTLLILKNGAEARGAFVEFADGKFTLILADGRLMSYAVSEVSSMKRLAANEMINSVPALKPTPDFDPASCRIFLTETNIDKALYTPIREIKVSKGLYGAKAEMFDPLARKAEKVGADAVINIRTWHSPSGFSWAAPHAGGMAVKWTEAGWKALQGLEGRCYGADEQERDK